MSNGFDNSNLNPFLKHTYTPDYIDFVATGEHPTLAMLAKDMKFGAGEGSNGTKQLTIKTARAQGGTADFDQAQTNAASAYTRGTRMSLSAKRIYQLAQVDGLTWDALSSNSSAQLDAAQAAVDDTMKALGDKLAKQIFRPGWGAIGISNTAAAGQTYLDLTNPEDAINFEIGMVIVASSSLNAAALRSSGASLTVAGVDFATGRITMTGNISGIAALGVGDYLFIKGDREDSATPTRQCIAGFGDWVPDTAPSVSESFNGVDRSGKSRLYGAAIDVSGYGTRDGIIYGLQKLHGIGARPGNLIMNPKNYGRLMMELASGGVFQQIEVKAGTSGALVFPAVKLFTNYGALTIVEDNDCPVDRGYALKMDSWKLGSIGGLPKLLSHGGQNTAQFAVYNKDRVEIRCGGYGELYCEEPSHNGVLKFA